MDALKKSSKSIIALLAVFFTIAVLAINCGYLLAKLFKANSEIERLNDKPNCFKILKTIDIHSGEILSEQIDGKAVYFFKTASVGGCKLLNANVNLECIPGPDDD